MWLVWALFRISGAVMQAVGMPAKPKTGQFSFCAYQLKRPRRGPFVLGLRRSRRRPGGVALLRAQPQLGAEDERCQRQPILPPFRKLNSSTSMCLRSVSCPASAGSIVYCITRNRSVSCPLGLLVQTSLSLICRLPDEVVAAPFKVQRAVV